jgi:hypothetical protein
MPDFTRAFVESNGAPIQHDGLTLHSSLRLQVSAGDLVHIFFEHFVARPVQGLVIQAANRAHKLTIARSRHNMFVLWTDIAPRHVEVAAPAKARKPVELIVSNVWRDEKYGTMMYGLNAAAMVIEQPRADEWTLACSDGWGVEPDFSDLVVRLLHEHRKVP